MDTYMPTRGALPWLVCAPTMADRCAVFTCVLVGIYPSGDDMHATSEASWILLSTLPAKALCSEVARLEAGLHGVAAAVWRVATTRMAPSRPMTSPASSASTPCPQVALQEGALQEGVRSRAAQHPRRCVEFTHVLVGQLAHGACCVGAMLGGRAQLQQLVRLLRPAVTARSRSALRQPHPRAGHGAAPSDAHSRVRAGLTRPGCPRGKKIARAGCRSRRTRGLHMRRGVSGSRGGRPRPSELTNGGVSAVTGMPPPRCRACGGAM